MSGSDWDNVGDHSFSETGIMIDKSDINTSLGKLGVVTSPVTVAA